MTGEAGPDLRQATIAGVRWITSARFVAEITALASVIVLARLIPPAEFGRAAVALIAAGFAVVLGPLGLTATLVQRPTLERRHVESAAFLCLSLGTLLTAATLAFSFTAAEPVFGSRTAGLLALASPVWLLSGLGGVPQALLQRELRFARIASIESVPVVLAAGTTVLGAVLGLDGEALVAGAIVLRGSSSAIALVSVPFVRPRPSGTGVAEVGGFGTRVMLSSAVYLGFTNVDYAILGARLPADQVGFYWRAYQLGVDYQGKISQIMLRVSFPVYSRAKDLDELRRLRARIVRTHATVLLPLLAAFVAVAPIFIPWVFGPVWEPAVLPAQIMAVAGMADAVMTGAGPLLVAVGRPGVLLALNVVELSLFATMVLILAEHGLIAVATGVALFHLASLLALQTVILGPIMGLGLTDLVKDVLPGATTGACVLAALFVGREALGAGLPAAVLLAILGVLGAAVYGVVLRVFFRDAWNDLVSIGRRVGGRAPAPAET